MMMVMTMMNRFKETLGYSKDLSYAELADQIRESEEKRLAGEKDAKGREDKKGHHADSKRHVGPFEIKIVDQFLAKYGAPSTPPPYIREIPQMLEEVSPVLSWSPS
jgi:hypothetical protein